MKKLLAFAIALVLVTMAMAGWNHVESIFDFSAADTVKVGGTGSLSGDWFAMQSPHGVVVDADGKIWVAMHDGYGPDQSGSPEFLGVDHGDSDDDGVVDNDTCHYKPLFCFNPDGTPASFAPITMLTFPDATTDTIYAESVNNGSGKGITLDMDGNILFSSWSTIYRINYQTGAGMNYYTPSVMGSITEAVQDPETELIFFTWVLDYGNGQPIVMLDDDFSLVGNAVDSLGQITRSIIARTNTDNSTDIYVGTTWNGNGVLHFKSTDAFLDPFLPIDTLGNFDEYVYEDSTYTNVKLWSSSLDWTPDGDILVGALRMSWAGPLGSRWWIIDPETGEYLEEIGVAADDEYTGNPDLYMAGGANGPRGGFFTDATTLYTVDFYTWTLDKWSYSESIDGETAVPYTMKLSQNYPNPFNPNTIIPFDLKEKGIVTMRIFDMLGREVMSFDDITMDPGHHEIAFDASGLATGTYFCTLKVGDQVMSIKMLYVK